MGAIDTVAFNATLTGAANYIAAATATGDSLTVRNFASGNAYLEQISRDGATTGAIRIRSPLLHDNVTGINFHTTETPSVFLVPAAAQQNVRAGDTLIAEIAGTNAEVDVGFISIYYTNLSGSSARLNDWGAIAGLVKNIKSVQVAVTASGTVGTWVDTLVTVTENQLHADSDYAVIGWQCDTSLACVAVKGQDTGNLRIGGPGINLSYDTGQWFYQQDQDSQLPYIPVFNANNRNSFYVSVLDKAASTTANVTLILAELSSPAPV